MTNEMRPIVIRRTGRDAIFTTGFTRLLMIPNTTATAMSFHQSRPISRCICGTSSSATYRATAVIAVRTMKSTIHVSVTGTPDGGAPMMADGGRSRRARETAPERPLQPRGAGFGGPSPRRDAEDAGAVARHGDTR